MSPTAKALKYLAAEGYLADVVERRITRTLKRDWMGFADIIAIHPINDSLAIQVTSKSNMAAREKKIRAIFEENPTLGILMHQDWQAWVMGFAPGSSKASMVPRIVTL